MRRRTPYKRNSRKLLVRIFVEDEEEDIDMNDEESIHMELKIEKADNCLDVLLRDMK